jgi:uncharacterized protein YdeI (YjbR/CyaY-like superfamily)
MAKKIPEIDAYIERAAPFAKPILKHFRKLVHQACPEVEERVKWSFPHYDYLGGPMCSSAAFKQHCAIGFWKAALMKDADILMENARSEESMGHLGRISSLKDLPPDAVIVKFIKDAMRLNESGIKLSTKKPAVRKDLEVPDYFMKALKKNRDALKTFEAFPYSKKKDYVEWVTEAKTEETRNKRLETAVEWMSEGKSRHWKYAK